jgi:hypothetical protein
MKRAIKKAAPKRAGAKRGGAKRAGAKRSPAKRSTARKGGARKGGARRATKGAVKRTRNAGAALKQAIKRMPPQLREVAAEAVHAVGERIRLRAAPAELTSEAVHAMADMIDDESARRSD